MDLALRPAVLEDHASFVRFLAELSVEDPVPSPEEWQATQMANSRFAMSGGEIVGYAWYRRYAHTGHVCHLVTEPAWRGRRVGDWLLRALAVELRGLGCTEWYLNVKRSNEAAIRLYTRVGFQAEGGAFVLRFPWSAVEGLGPAEAGVVAAAPKPEDHGGIEAQFSFPAGRVDSLVSDPADVPVVLRSAAEPGEILGFERFSPSFPGMMPFCAVRPTLGRNLLEAARPHRRPADEEALIVVEGSPDLAAHLLANGGQLRFEIIRMAAPLPI